MNEQDNIEENLFQPEEIERKVYEVSLSHIGTG